MEQPWESHFDPIAPTPEQLAIMNEVRESFKHLAAKLQHALPPGRCKALVLTHLQASAMMASRAAVGG